MGEVIIGPEVFRRKRINERLASILLLSVAVLTVVVLTIIVGTLVSGSIPFFREASIAEFLAGSRWTVLFKYKNYGSLPLLAGTFLTSIIAITVSGILGLGSAIYLSEYAAPRLRRILKPALEVLAGIPTVVYGYFALYYITPVLRRLISGIDAHNALSAGIAMGIMITPIIASISEDALYSVPESLRMAAYALGASKIHVVFRVVLRAALPGIIAAYILGFARALGETMIVTIAAGFRPVLTLNPLVSIQTMTSYIAQVATGDAPRGTVEYYSLFAIGLYLLVVVLAFNTLGMLIARKYALRLRQV